MNVLKNIRESRTQKHLSQEVIADALGMTTSNYSRRESGQYALTVNELVIIAKTFDLTPMDIFTWPQKHSLLGGGTVSEPGATYMKPVEVCDNCRVLRKYIKLLEEKIDIYERRK